MIEQVIRDMILYFNKDARRINHALKVYAFATVIAGIEQVSDEMKEIIALSAILHDIGILEAQRKYNSTAGKYQELEGPPIAEDILYKNGYSQEVIDRVSYLVGHHHSYSAIKGLDFQILVESDFLVNINEDNMKPSEVSRISEQYFKTMAGVQILSSLYLG